MIVQLRLGLSKEGVDQRGWLIEGKNYHVLSIETYLSGKKIGFRVESENAHTPGLFDSALFDIVDGHMPACWVVAKHSPESVAIGPIDFITPGFWERYFDGDSTAIDLYTKLLAEISAVG